MDLPRTCTTLLFPLSADRTDADRTEVSTNTERSIFLGSCNEKQRNKGMVGCHVEQYYGTVVGQMLI